MPEVERFFQSAIPLKLKRNFYKTTIKPTMLYGEKCWAANKQHVHKKSVPEITIMRWMSGNTKNDGIKNKSICEYLVIK